VTKTTFIIGAGASAEFGLPVGEGLIAKIVEQLKRFDGNWPEQERWDLKYVLAHMNSGSFDPEHYATGKRLRQALLHANTIDQLLHQRRDDLALVHMGKMAIATCIADAEAQSSLINLGVRYQQVSASVRRPIDATVETLEAVSQTWIAQFIRHAGQPYGPRDIAKAFDGISFVCFNYDRCIQQYLYHALVYSWQIDKEEASQIVHGLDFMHVYGDLAPLSFPALDGNGFGDVEKVIHALDRIRTYTETIDEAWRDRIRQTVKSAERIVFLGFGFDRQNLQLLFDNKLSSSVDLRGTLYFDPKDADLREQVLDRLFAQGGGSASSRERFIEATKAGEYMRKRGPILFPPT